MAKFREIFIKIGEKINENCLKIAIFHKINENLESDFVQDPQDADDGPDDDDEDEFVPEDEV